MQTTYPIAGFGTELFMQKGDVWHFLARIPKGFEIWDILLDHRFNMSNMLLNVLEKWLIWEQKFDQNIF